MNKATKMSKHGGLLFLLCIAMLASHNLL